MDLARAVCSSVLTVRETYKRRVRLPLASLTVAHPDCALLEPFVGVIADEVNVKAVHLTADTARYGKPEIKVEPTLGKIYGPKMKPVFAAQRSGEWTMEADGQLAIGGLVPEPHQYKLRVRVAGDVAAESFDGGRGLVLLDTALTEELQAEGWARDVVRLVQNARKLARLEMTDRIRLALQVHGPLRAALITHGSYILQQVLATEIDYDADLPKDGEGVVIEVLEEQEVRLAISRKTAVA
jgi:isoleucyl-tRNA synthetase